MPITLKQLRYFIRVVESGSISGSARSLNVAQTALGAQIRLLEQRLGAALLVRETRGVRATDAGQHLYSRAKEIIAGLEETRREIAKLVGDERRSLFVGLAPSLRAAIGHELLQHGELPGSSLFLCEGMNAHLLDDLRSGMLDYVITHAAVQQPGLRAVPVLRQPLLLVTGPGADAPRGPVAFRDALEGPLVLNTRNNVSISIIEREAETRGLPLKVAYRTDSEAALKKIISQGLAWGILPAELVAPEVARGDMAAYPIVDPALDVTAFFVVKEASLGDGLDTGFLQLLDRLLDEHSAGCTCRRLDRVCSLMDGTSV